MLGALAHFLRRCASWHMRPSPCLGKMVSRRGDVLPILPVPPAIYLHSAPPDVLPVDPHPPPHLYCGGLNSRVGVLDPKPRTIMPPSFHHGTADVLLIAQGCAAWPMLRS
jgi:hypothetical protein